MGSVQKKESAHRSELTAYCCIERNLMPNPKRRHSQRRTSTRRAHDALKSHSLSECPNCHERKLPHRACPKCGYYKGRELIDVEEAS